MSEDTKPTTVEADNRLDEAIEKFRGVSRQITRRTFFLSNFKDFSNPAKDDRIKLLVSKMGRRQRRGWARTYAKMGFQAMRTEMRRRETELRTDS